MKKTILAATLLALCACLPGGTNNIAGQVIIEDAPGSPPTCATSTAAGELCVEGDIEANGNIDNAGTLTQTGAATFTAAVTCNSTIDANGDISAGGGAGALTFDAASSSIVTTDNVAAGLVMGSTGALSMLILDTQNDAEQVRFTNGMQVIGGDITDAVTMDAADCGKTFFVTAGIDTKTITLPAQAAAFDGCSYEFIYTGADDGALVDISPNASDAIHGSCTLAASVLEFNGTDDNDIGLTKNTSNTGDRITLVGDGANWYVSDCAGIWANN